VLFNSFAFIFGFLPVTFAGGFWLARRSTLLAALWLGVASLVFYGAWDPRFVPLLLGSIAFNYAAGRWIGGRVAAGGPRGTWPLAAAVGANLALLGYFKYANFFLAAAGSAWGWQQPALDIVLPLGISFFTFTQIAFLVDVSRGSAREYSFVHYLLFVTYFPHLIAGPVLHHAQMMPQFADPRTWRIDRAAVAAGWSIFVLGLAKKVLLADSLGAYARPVFGAAGNGHPVMLYEAWVGALSYALQLYFDFSGYSDMAVGLSLLFNVRLPQNFDSPYKATSIIDYWHRWHMTLSTFLRDYLYIPLGGNRRGAVRRAANLMATMLLGGLWHGAGWTFVCWGGLHGAYLLVNHGWRALKRRSGWGDGGAPGRLAAGALTFVAVVTGLVVFRAEKLADARAIVAGMAGLNGVSVPDYLKAPLAPLLARLPLEVFFVGGLTGHKYRIASGLILAGLGIVWLLPNLRQLFWQHRPTWEDVAGAPRAAARGLQWQPTTAAALLIGVLFFVCLLFMAARPSSEFLYFQF
jgi:D-alanyl-lipoteichoic acid acyltransferase DltB (MBOAT superfamily)